MKGPLLSDFTLKKVHFCQCHNKTFEEFYAKPKKRSTFVGFLAKKRPLLRNFALNPKKRSTFVGFHAIKGPLLRNFALNPKKGPLLSDFTL